MKAGAFVRIIKRAQSSSPFVPAGEWGSYIPGAWPQSTSLPVDYEIVGYLVDDIEVDKPVRLLRIARNGTEILGIYQSTPVLELRSDGYITRNSVYSVDVVESQLG
jgi:hypothetical protein